MFENPYGASATGLPYMAGQITLEDLQSGAINHVIGLAVITPSSRISWPASRADWNSGFFDPTEWNTEIMKKFPWDKIKFLPADDGKPSER
jgi:hypothetical protein